MRNNNNTDILLRLLLEDKFSAELDKTLDNLEGRLKQASSVKDVESLERQFRDVKDVINEATQALSAQGAVLRANAALLANQVTQMRARSAEAARLSSSLGQYSGLALGAGTGIVGGIFAEVNNYVKNAKEATAITRAWKQETDSLARSRARIDEVLAREALPMLREVARLASQAAGFVETHPEIVQAALNTGKILIALGAVGMLASRGIKLYADILYLQSVPVQLQAAQLQALAAQNQLAAAKLKASELGVSAPGAAKAGGLGLMGTIGLVVAGLAASAAVVGLVDQILENSRFGQQRKDAIDRARDQGARIYPGILPPAERDLQVQLNRAQMRGDTDEVARLREEIDNLGNTAKEASDTLQAAAGQLKGSVNEEAIVSAFIKWKEDDKRLVEEAAENRRKIVADAEKQIAAATQKYAQQRVDINRQFDKARASIIQDFAESSRQAEINYARQRADIVKDAGEEIQQIEERHQENIRKMTLEHNDRVDELTAARDALGLAQEQRRFDRDISEAEREINKEIAQRRRDTAIRLQELAAEFALERAQRQADFEAKLAENEQRRQEELKQAAFAHEEEMKQIRANRAQQLRELQESLNAERLRRREVLIAEIRDLDAALLGERAMKKNYYTLMLQEAQAFITAYRSTLNTGSSLSGATGTSGGYPVQDSGGYVARGVYKMAWNGAEEFVMNNATTRAAERAIGGRLTQDSLMRALAGRGQVVWNDHRRFDSSLSLADRRAITEDTVAVIRQEIS